MRFSAPLAQAFASICGCRACLASRTKLLHSGSHSATRRNARQGPPTTFIFSALFTVAATADARVKSTRRQKLNEDIDSAEKDLERGRAEEESERKDGYEQRASDQSSFNDSPLAPPSEEQEIQAVLRSLPWKLRPSVLSDTDRNELINSVLSFLDPTQPDLPQLWARNLNVHRGSLFISDIEKESKPEKWSPKKLRTLEVSVAKLVAGMSLEASERKPGNRETAMMRQTLLNTIKTMSERLAKLSKRDPWRVEDIAPPPRPNYIPNPPRSLQDDVELKGSIDTIFHRLEAEDIDLKTAVEDIIHNILVAPQPPNNQTYSTLIDKFSRLGYYRLADMALESMMEGHRRPDERCVVNAVDHLRRKGDAKQFEKFRLRAKGYFGSLISPYWEHDLGSSGKDESPLSTARKGRVVMGLRPTGPIYTSLMQAFLKFGRIEDAMKTFKNVENSSLEMPKPLLALLLRHLVDNCRVAEAKHVWQSFLERLGGSYEEMSKADEASCREAFQCALRLFETTHQWEQRGKVHLAGEKLGFLGTSSFKLRHHAFLPEELKLLTRQRKLLEEKVEHSRARVQELDRKLLALCFIFRSGHAFEAIRQAYIRLGEEVAYVQWAVAQIAHGENVWIPASWKKSFGTYKNGRWRFTRIQTRASHKESNGPLDSARLSSSKIWLDRDDRPLERPAGRETHPRVKIPTYTIEKGLDESVMPVYLEHGF